MNKITTAPGGNPSPKSVKPAKVSANVAADALTVIKTAQAQFDALATMESRYAHNEIERFLNMRRSQFAENPSEDTLANLIAAENSVAHDHRTIALNGIAAARKLITAHGEPLAKILNSLADETEKVSAKLKQSETSDAESIGVARSEHRSLPSVRSATLAAQLRQAAKDVASDSGESSPRSVIQSYAHLMSADLLAI